MWEVTQFLRALGLAALGLTLFLAVAQRAFTVLVALTLVIAVVGLARRSL